MIDLTKRPRTLSEHFGYHPKSFAEFVRRNKALMELEEAKEEQRIREHLILTGRLK